MRTMESERGVKKRGSGRRKGGISTQSGIIIGVVAVAGLGLVGKLVSILRAKPREPKDPEIEALEAVVNGEPAKHRTLQAQMQMAKLADLENEEPDHVLTNGKHFSATGPSEFADSFSEEVPPDEFPEGGEMFVSQEPAAKPAYGKARGKKEDMKDVKALAHVGFQKKGEHIHNEGGVKNRKMPELEEVSNDAEDAAGSMGTGAKPKPSIVLVSKYAVHLSEAEGNVSSSPRSCHACGKWDPSCDKFSKTKAEEADLRFGCSTGGNGGTASTSANSGKLASSMQKKSRRPPSDKRVRKAKPGSVEPDFDPLQKKGSTERRNSAPLPKEALDSYSQSDSVNGYKVFINGKSHRGQLEEQSLAEVLDEFKDAVADTLKPEVMAEFERERKELGENLKAQDLWDGKDVGRDGDLTELLKGKEEEACLRIKSSVVSSVSNAEETPEGVILHEVVRRSTLLPIPAGEEGSVHSSVYNVVETNEGLKVEEIVKRSTLLPASGEDDFTISDRQVLGRQKSTRKRTTIVQMIPLLLRFLAVLIAILSILIVLLSRKRISLPHLSFFY